MEGPPGNVGSQLETGEIPSVTFIQYIPRYPRPFYIVSWEGSHDAPSLVLDSPGVIHRAPGGLLCAPLFSAVAVFLSLPCISFDLVYRQAEKPLKLRECGSLGSCF